ncbi:MAG: putative glycoside hydrolase, partial [Bacillota bacterium]
MRKPFFSAVVQSVLLASLFVTACNLPSGGGTTPPGPSGQVPVGNITGPGGQDPGGTTDPGADDPGTAAPGGATDPGASADPGGSGNAQAPENGPQPGDGPARPAREMPDPVRGLHLSGWYAGSPDLVWPLLDWAKEAGINTIVVDLKAEDGYLSWESDIPLAQEIGANMRKIADLPAFIAEAHDRGFWVAGRIVVMNDQWLYKARPEWAIPGFDGGAYSFMDPANENVWKYNVD